MRITTRTVAVLLAAGGLLPAAAERSAGTQAWRCGNAYSDQPCAGGRRIAAEDARSTEQQREAEAAARRVQQEADAWARERRAREAAALRRGPVLIDNAPVPAPPPAAQARPARERRGKVPGDFVASSPKTDEKKKKKKGN